MASPGATRPTVRAHVTRTAAFLAAYAIAVAIGRATRIDDTQVVLVWPAAGVGLVWLLDAWHRPRQLALDVVLLAAAVIGGNLLTGAPAAPAMASGLANVVQALVGCAVVARVAPHRRPLEDLRSLAALLAGALGGAAAGGVVGPLALRAGLLDDWAVPWALWALRNGIGALCVAALVMSVQDAVRLRRPVSWRRAEVLPVLALCVVVHVLVFVVADDAPITFLALLVTAWIAIRSPLPVSTAHNVVVAGIVTVGTLAGRGPFADQATEPRVALAQAFVGATTALTLMLAVHRDERARLLSRLDRSERRHRRITEGAGLVLFEADERGHWTFLSPGWEAVTGRDVGASLGVAARDLVHPDDLEDARVAFAAVLSETTEALGLDHRFEHPRLGERWLHVDAHLATNAAGERRVAGTLQDVTDRKAAELELEAERGFTAALLESLDTGIVACDADGTLRLFNDATRRMHGLPAVPIGSEEWASRFSLFRGDGTTPLRADEVPLARALAGEDVQDAEMVIAPRARPAVTVSATGRPIVDAGGRRLGAVVAMHDVTARRAAEDALRQSVEDLAGVTEVAHALAAQTEVGALRETICSAVRRSADATTVLLLEPTPDNRHLRSTAGIGAEGAGEFVLPMHGHVSGSVTAFTSATALFVADAVSAATVDQQSIARVGTRSALFHPVLREGRPVAVLAVGWAEPIAEVPARVGQIVELLAAEAAIAIERADLVDELTATARTDALTGAANRRSWDERLPRTLERARRGSEPLCVAMLDIDHFKAFNDAHGHQRGDALLREATAAWMSEVRTGDTLARYGGEEFILALPSCEPMHALRLAERLRLLVPQGQTCSIGIALWDGQEPADQLVARADDALYEAKSTGRDRVVLAGDAAPDAMSLVLRLARQALGMDVAFLARIEGDELRIKGVDGAGEALGVRAGESTPLEDTLCARMLDGRTTGLVPDTSADRHTAEPAGDAVGAYVGAPVHASDGRVLGTLCGLSRRPAAHLEDEHQQLLERLAGAVAIELERDEAPATIEATWERIVRASRSDA